MASDKQASNKPVALVTGAGWWPEHIPGIGHAIALALGREGHRVIVSDRELEPAERSAKDLREKGVDAGAVALDVTDNEQANQVAQALIAQEGHIDVLINAAALTLNRWGLKRFHDITPEQCDTEIDVTLKGALNVTRNVLPHMLERERGNIIFISSVMGLEPAPRMTIYGLSKAALASFTTSLAGEVGPRGIRVNAICPGSIRTRVATKMPEWINEAFFKRSAMSRGGEPEEIANVAVFLTSEKASYVNGQCIRVDGGVQGLLGG